MQKLDKSLMALHRYYSNLIITNPNEIKLKYGTVSESELARILSSKPANSEGAIPAKSLITSYTNEQITEIKKRFVTYNAIYDKLFANFDIDKISKNYLKIADETFNSIKQI